MSNAKPVTFDQIQKSVEAILKDSSEFCFLLGSAGTPRFNDESDIDLAVFFKEKQDHKALSEWTSKFCDEFHRDFDLVQLNSVDPIFARQVLVTGRELLVTDRSFFNVWKSEQLSQYPDFKASRKIIEDHLLNRKKYV